MRILLRQRATGLYWQPSGVWGPARDSARSFANSFAAYRWAREQRLLGIEVLMAFNDQEYDLISMQL